MTRLLLVLLLALAGCADDTGAQVLGGACLAGVAAIGIVTMNPMVVADGDLCAGG